VGKTETGFSLMADPFHVSRRKVARAKKHVVDFEREIRVFLQNSEYSIVREPDPQHAEHEIHKVRFKDGLPDSLIDPAVECIHNLRSCLDNAVCASAIAGGTANPKCAFPFSGSFIEFGNNFKGRCKGEMPGVPLKLAAPVHPTLRRLSSFDNF
jgi:hypothetical protein